MINDRLMIIMQNRIIRLFNRKTMIKICLSFIICHLSFNLAQAQSFTQQVQQQNAGEGKVTIHHDQAIDQLVNGKITITAPTKNQTEKTRNTTTAKTTPTNTQQHAGAAAAQGSATHQGSTSQQNSTSATTHQTEHADTSAAAQTSSRHAYKTTGFRVQAFAGGNTRRDRQRAEQTGNVMRQQFPGTDVYVRFFSPRWVCRVGNYRTYEEAREMMYAIRKLGYESATIVKGKIIVTQ
jgi:Cu/Ag efflux protein CusF